MVEVLIIEYQGIIEQVELFKLPLDADQREINLILKYYDSYRAYKTALDASDADYVVHHLTDLKVK